MSTGYKSPIFFHSSQAEKAAETDHCTVNVRVKSGPQVPMESQEKSRHVRRRFTEAKPEVSLFWR